MGIPDAVRQWLASFDGPADPSETPEPVGEGEDPTTEADENLNPEPTDDAPDAAADTPVDENTDTTPEGESRTAPEPATPLTDTERDALNTLAAENEALREENNHFRNRIAELGGDAALGIVEEAVEEIPDESEDEYDPDADLAEQEAALASLRGEK